LEKHRINEEIYMSKEKVVNYDAEAEALLREVYGTAENDADRKVAVANLAETLGKTPASVRAKLSNMELYVKPERVTKNGDPIVKKDELVELIATQIGKPSDELPGLEKANKTTLQALVEATAVKDAS
jgi:hypothetical protein